MHRGVTDGMKGKFEGNYAAVNGLEMYYEVHGEGQPLILLHAGVDGRTVPRRARRGGRTSGVHKEVICQGR
jgi:hypothetical protein